MKKALLGDVYAFKTDRGYRILHWAYHIEKMGKYVRIMPGFYPQKPENLKTIVDSECLYIMSFDAPKAYRKGLFENWGNQAVSSLYPFPTHDINYFQYSDRGEFEICEFFCHQHFERYIGDSFGHGIPEKYKDVKLINAIVDPISFLALISSDFDLYHWHLFYSKERWIEYEKKYGDIIFGKGKTKA